jgi:hypothetical protein
MQWEETTWFSKTGDEKTGERPRDSGKEAMENVEE